MKIELRYLADVNPETLDFDIVSADDPVVFMPLETVWADARMDISRVRPRGEVANGYMRFRSGDILCPKVTPTFQAARSALIPELPSRVGAASTEVHVLRARPDVDPRYVRYGLLSKPFLDEGVSRFQGVAGLQRVPEDFIRSFRVEDRALAHQRDVSDYLDGQIARIDNVIAARRSQIDRLGDEEARHAFDIATADGVDDRRPTGLGWLPTIPVDWPMATVHAGFSVLLGKMLDESKFTGRHAIPYLRNTNVQWDRVTTDDLKVMDIAPDERERFTVRSGDLLICEGGQPGRSAIWDGAIQEMGYQKALHRARARGDSDVRWLQLMLRVAVRANAFAIEFGQATIGHLTGEQLRGLRIPMPGPDEQRLRVNRFDAARESLRAGHNLLATHMARCEELKRSLITAAVTGEFDVQSADGSQVPVPS